MTPEQTAEAQFLQQKDRLNKDVEKLLRGEHIHQTHRRVIIGSYIRTLESEHARMKEQLRTDKHRFTEPTFHCAWPEAAEAIQDCLSSVTL